MRLPIIPFLVAAILLAGAAFLFNRSVHPDMRVLDISKISRLADIEGVETEVAISPDGSACAVIADGDLWTMPMAGGPPARLTQTPEAESFPAWAPDGKRLTFTRGTDTFLIQPGGPAAAQPFKKDATSLSWSPSGRQVYVRNRGLWMTDAGGINDKQVVAPEENPNITLRTPRFSPTSLDVAYIKTMLGFSGQVWTLDASNGNPRALIADRPNEMPLDVGWILGGRELVYLTNRSGSYSIWHVNFKDNTLLPLTAPLMLTPLASLGISVWNDRIVLPRHVMNSRIVLSDGKAVTPRDGGDTVEGDPSVSPDGKLVAYTVMRENKAEIWTVNIDGSHAAYRTVGHDPRFTPDGFQVLYTHANLDGNDDVWRFDMRDGSTERITDADELDMTADASPDGQSVVFTSTRGVAPSIWVVAASGGKRLRLNDGGFGPRFSPDSRSILYWNRGEFWTMDANGSNAKAAGLAPAAIPSLGEWHQSMPIQMAGNELRGSGGAVLFKSDRPLWPHFDVMPDGRFLIAPIDIRDTGLWAIDLQFKIQQ